MELNTPKPGSLDDAGLLRLVLRLFEIEHLTENLDGKKAFVSMLGVSTPHIDNCLRGKSHLGIEQWAIILPECGAIARAQFQKYITYKFNGGNNGNQRSKTNSGTR